MPLVSLGLRPHQNGTITLTLSHTRPASGNPILDISREIRSGQVVATIDKVTGELKSNCMKFKPWGRKKFMADVLRQMKALC